jgi:hypothetical protein
VKYGGLLPLSLHLGEYYTISLRLFKIGLAIFTPLARGLHPAGAQVVGEVESGSGLSYLVSEKMDTSGESYP